MSQYPTISKMETTQTAVEWLSDNLIGNPYTEEDFRHNVSVFQQAKQMEKEQIINAVLEEHMFDDSEYANRRYKYWQQVKQEIKNL